MNKFGFIFAAIVVAVVGQSIHKLTLGEAYTGTLVTEDYNLFYVDYPENYTYLQIDVTGTTIPSQSCSYIYTYANPLSFPCGSEPEYPLENEYDPCYDSSYQYLSPSSTGETETYYIFAGQYKYMSYSFGYFSQPSGGRTFFSVNKGDEDYNCGFSIKVSVPQSCPSALNANNGIAVGDVTSSYFYTYEPDVICAVYTNISLVAGQAVTTQIVNGSSQVVYKTVVPKNAAYINFTYTGASLVSGSSYIYVSPRVAVNDSSSSLNCYSSLSFGSTNLNGTTTFTCTNLPAGPVYIVITFPEPSDGLNSVNGTLSSTLVVCPDGTATGYDSNNQEFNCSASYYFNASSLLTAGAVNFTGAEGDFKTGWIDFPPQLVGGSVTLNFTGSPSSTTTYLYVGLYINNQDESNRYSTSSANNGLTLSPFDTDVNGNMNLNNQRIYISFYCSTGPCAASVFLSGVVTPTPPAAVTTSTVAPNPPAAVTTARGLTTSVQVTTGPMNATNTTSVITSRATTSGNANSALVNIPSVAIALFALVAALF